MSKKGKKLQTKILGEENTICVALVHGWGIDSGILTSLAERLANDMRVVLIDLPGYGMNQDVDFPEDYDELVELVSNSVDSPAYWMGWSFGTTVVLGIAKNFSDKVEGVISLAGTPCFVNNFDDVKNCWRNGIEKDLAEEFVEELDKSSERCLKNFEAQIAALETRPREILKIIRSNRNGKLPNKDALKRSVTILHGSDLRADLAELDKPALWMFGDNDAFIKPIPNKLLKTGHSDTRTTILLRTGHLPFLSAEEDVSHLVKKFTGVY